MTTAPSPVLRGRCLCGGVALALVPPTLFASHCHCASCRRAHAAPFVTWTAVPAARFEVERGADLVRAFASSPGVLRHGCSRCGTPLHYLADGVDKVYVPVAILDALDRPVDSHVSYEERVPWLTGVERLPCFEAKSDAPRPW